MRRRSSPAAAGHKLFFSGLDAETCRSLEQALGQNTVYDTYCEGVSEHARILGVPLMGERGKDGRGRDGLLLCEIMA